MPIGGYSYQPDATGLNNASDGNQTGGAISPQEAVRVLSLRLPKRLPNSPIPSSLLSGAGGGGSGNLNALVQALMQAFGASGGASGGRSLVGPGPDVGADAGINLTPQAGDTAMVQPPTLPAPRITIGDDPSQRTPLGGDGGPTPRPPDLTGGVPAFRRQFGTGGGREGLF